MKQCLFCSEKIQDAAVVCRHCGRDIAPQSTTETATTDDRTDSHQERMYVVGESHYQEAVGLSIRGAVPPQSASV